MADRAIGTWHLYPASLLLLDNLCSKEQGPLALPASASSFFPRTLFMSPPLNSFLLIILFTFGGQEERVLCVFKLGL